MPASMKRFRKEIVVKEPASAFTHALGFIVSILVLVLLVVFASLHATTWHIVSFSIFGVSSILLYLASTMYHWLPLKPSQEKLFLKLDHSAIYLMIAGTYTPFCLVPLRGPWGWGILAVIWVAAVLGIYLQWAKNHRSRWLRTSLYLAMGWASVVAIIPLSSAIHWTGVLGIFLGGLFYSVGAVIYAIKKPNPWPRIFGFHEIFHCFVLLGSFAHMWLMFTYVLPFP